VPPQQLPTPQQPSTSATPVPEVENPRKTVGAIAEELRAAAEVKMMK